MNDNGLKIRFETCNRKNALVFLQELYPSCDITEEIAKDVLDLVEADIVRIPDPKMHGKRVNLYPSKNWNESKSEEYITVLKDFHRKALVRIDK